MEKFRNGFSKVVIGINSIGLLSCFVMVFVVAIDVILRKVTDGRLSITGSNEFSSYFLVVICMLAIPAFQVKKGHVWVNMFVDKFPRRMRSYWLGVVHIVETIVCAMFAYGSILKIQMFLDSGSSSDILNMPKWPFAAVCLVGFLELTVLMLIDAIQHFINGARGGEIIDEEI